MRAQDPSPAASTLPWIEAGWRREESGLGAAWGNVQTWFQPKCLLEAGVEGLLGWESNPPDPKGKRQMEGNKLCVLMQALQAQHDEVMAHMKS